MVLFSCLCGKTSFKWLDHSKKTSCFTCGEEVKLVENQTSLEAFVKIQDVVDGNRAIVLDTLNKLVSANNRMISESLGWSINRVTPRVKELRDMDFVVLDCVKVDITGVNTKFWKVNK